MDKDESVCVGVCVRVRVIAAPQPSSYHLLPDRPHQAIPAG